jgi:hypothetical protein
VKCHAAQKDWPGGTHASKHLAPPDVIEDHPCHRISSCNHSYICRRCYVPPEETDGLIALAAAADLTTWPTTPTRTTATKPTERPLSPMTPLSSISVNARPIRKLAPRSLLAQFRLCNIENNPDTQKPSHRCKRSSSLGRPINTLEWKRKVASDEKSPARQFLSRTSLYRYKKQLNEFKKVKSRRTRRSLPGSGRKPILKSEYENAIIEWMRSCRARNKKVRAKSIIKQALRLAEQYNITKFTASKGWLKNFKKRHKIHYRRITSLSRKLSNMQLDEFQKQYSQDIMNLKNTLQISESDIYNMDETPILFDTPGKSTYDFAGAKSVSVETTGNTKNRITLILCINWTGEKLIPFIIFKSLAKNQTFIERYPKDITKPVQAYFCGQTSATNDTGTMLEWIKHVFNNRENSSRPCILTMDNVSFHHSDAITNALRGQNVTLSYFPPNTTCRLQPLDHSINGVIKNKMDEYWNEYMDQHDLPRTDAGNLQRPSKEIILDWITRAFEELKSESIMKSFSSCWMCEKKKDLVAATTPAVPKPNQTAISMAIVPTPAITDISDELLQATAKTRKTAIPAQYSLNALPQTLAPLLVTPLIDDDSDDSDYSDRDTDCDSDNDDDDDDDDDDGGGDDDGVDDDGGGDDDGDDDDGGGAGDDDDDDDVGTRDDIIEEPPPTPKTKRRRTMSM